MTPKQRRKSNFVKKSKNHGPAHHRAGTAGAKSERHDARPIESETRGAASFRQRILRNEANKVPVFRQSSMGKRQGSGFDAFRCNPARRSEARLATFSSRARRCHAARGCTIRNLAGAILGGTDRAVDCKPDQSGSNLGSSEFESRVNGDPGAIARLHLSTAGTSHVTSGRSRLRLIFLSHSQGRISEIWISASHGTRTFLVCKPRCSVWRAN